MPKRHAEDRAVKIVAVLNQKAEDGSYLFSVEQLNELVPALFLGSGGKLALTDMPAELRPLVGQFVDKLNLSPSADKKEAAAAIQAYYAAKPVSPHLLTALKHLQQETAAEESEPEDAAQARKLVTETGGRNPSGVAGLAPGHSGVGVSPRGRKVPAKKPAGA